MKSALFNGENKGSASLSRLQTFYGDLNSAELLHAMITHEFSGKIALFSSFGADSALLIKLVADVDKATPVLFLETGKHFKETLEYVEDIKNYFGLTNLIYLKPDPELLKNTDPKGELWKSNVNRCCWLRKVEPLERGLKKYGFEALITGRKQYQTPERAGIESIELDEDGRFRINPLAKWTKEQFKSEFKTSGLAQHPLVSKGYLSIGCEPCTVAVKPGEDERSGRWAHTIDLQGKQKTECGIHLPKNNEGISWEV